MTEYEDCSICGVVPTMALTPPDKPWVCTTCARTDIPMPAADVISELVRLAVGSGWRRLEASTEGPHDVDGYCVTPTGMQVRTSEARRAHRDPIGLLIDLLTRSGWRRLEVLNRAGIRGWCVQADGTGVSIREFLPETTRP